MLERSEHHSGQPLQMTKVQKATMPLGRPDGPFQRTLSENHYILVSIPNQNLGTSSFVILYYHPASIGRPSCSSHYATKISSLNCMSSSISCYITAVK